MAIIRANVPVDFAAGSLPTGTVTKNTSTELVITEGTSTATFRGVGFTYSGQFITAGTVTGFTWSYGGSVAIEGSDFRADAPVVAEDILTGDLVGLLNYVLAGDDQIFGSAYSDRIAGGTGNDFLDPGSGDDDVYGASGIDTLYLDGALSDYEIRVLSPFSLSIIDRNMANGNEGSDIVYEFEFLQFSNGTSYSVTEIVNPVVWFQQGGNVSLVAATYQFFTDRIPTADGFGYLISSTANPNDLNDLYYANFNVENRYINFASNLGTAGEGATFFDRAYGSLNFADAVKTAYLEVMGKELMGAALDFFLNAQGFYQAVAAERVVRPGVDLSDATKIVAIGSILNEAVKLGQGPYADAVEVLVADVAPDGVSYKLGGDLFAVA